MIRTQVRRIAAGRDLSRLAREALLWFGAVAGLVCLVLAGLAVAFHISPVVFRSGSMAPAIDTGALALTRTVQAPDLKVGDIVTVTTDKGQRVTHRIQSITPNGSAVTLVLKGDANEVVDTEAYTVSSVDRVFFSVPQAGYAATWLSGRGGAFFGGLLIGLVVITAFGRGSRGTPDVTAPVVRYLRPPILEDPDEVAPPRRRFSGRRTAIAAGIAAAVALVAGIAGTNAYFLDSATVDSGTFTMKVQPVLSCTKGNSTVTMTWVATAGATSYTLHYGAGGATTESVSASTLSKSFTTVGQSGTFTVNAVTASGPGPLSNAKAYVIGNGVGNTSCTDA